MPITDRVLTVLWFAPPVSSTIWGGWRAVHVGPGLDATRAWVMSLLILVAVVAGVMLHLRRTIRLRAELEAQIRIEVLEQVAGRRLAEE